MYSKFIEIITENKLVPLFLKDSTASHLYSFQQGCKALGLIMKFIKIIS